MVTFDSTLEEKKILIILIAKLLFLFTWGGGTPERNLANFQGYKCECIGLLLCMLAFTFIHLFKQFSNESI